MKVSELVKSIGAEVITGPSLDREISGCYVSDLLSDVLAGSDEGNLWLTQHTHPNVVAVAAVKGVSAVVIVGGKKIADDTLERAGTEDVNLISTELSAFAAAGKIYSLLENEEAG